MRDETKLREIVQFHKVETTTTSVIVKHLKFQREEMILERQTGTDSEFDRVKRIRACMVATLRIPKKKEDNLTGGLSIRAG